MMRTLSQLILISGMVLAASAQAQYYGGVSLGNDRQRVQSGFNGGESPSEQVALSALINTTNGLNL